MTSPRFLPTQVRWMEQIMQNPELCDAVFEVGKEKRKMYGMRSLLANISPVFKAQFYGSFKESNLDSTISYPTISPPVFECIIRASFCLDPKITTATLVPLIHASRMLQIPELEKECQNYVDINNVLEIFHSAFVSNRLTEQLFRKCRRVILAASNTVISQKSFSSLHPDLIIYIISCDFFIAKEENIWKACLNWAKNVSSNSIKFPTIKDSVVKSNEVQKVNDDDEKETKSNETEMAPTEISEIMETLQPIILHIRLPLIQTTFFVDNVKDYLTRKQLESVMIYYLLKRKSIFSDTPRTSPGQNHTVVLASCALETAKKMMKPNTAANWAGSSHTWGKSKCPWFVVDIALEGYITEFEIQNHWEDNDTVKKILLQVSNDRYNYTKEGNDWTNVESFDVAKSKRRQKFVVQTKKQYSQYWRFVVSEIYGSDDNYWGINHLKLTANTVV